MGWFPTIINSSDVPNVDIDDAEVALQAQRIETASGKFSGLADTLTETWHGVASTYDTSHTQAVIATMDPIIDTATRAEWVYGSVAGALGNFVDELRACRVESNSIKTAVRLLHNVPDVQLNALLPGTPEFNRNVALRQRAGRLCGRIQRAKDVCKARLDAIGEDANAYDPYNGVTSVDESGLAFNGLENVTDRALNWDLYGKSGTVRGSQVNQGALGDCWFLASLAALADKDPSAIERMIHDNGNGTYSVTLFIDGKWQSIQVDNSMLIGDNGRPQFAGSGDPLNNDQALWPLLIEKAAIKAYGGDYFTLNAGLGEMSMEVFTGNPASTDMITPNHPLDDNAMARYAELSRDDNVIMTANSNLTLSADTPTISVAVEGSKDPVQIWFYENHVYQIADVDSAGNVTLVNPHNSDNSVDGSDYDRFTITSDQFQDLFFGVSVGRIN